MASPESTALRHVFFAERAARKVPGIDKETPVRPIESAAIVGAGTMGRGIATCFANAGIPVRLMDSDTEALERALAAIRGDYERRVARGRIGAADAEARIGLIEPIETMEGVAGADLVIEAVFEEMPLKEEVFRTLDSVCDEGAIIASNTSYLDVNHLADIVPRRRGQRPRHALLQPGAGDAPPGGGAHRFGHARDAGHRARAGPAARQARGGCRRLPRLHRQPHARGVHAASALPAGRGCVAGRDRRRAHRVRDGNGAMRGRQPRRPRRELAQAQGGRPSARSLQALFGGSGPAVRAGPLRPEDRRRLLPLRARQPPRRSRTPRSTR